MIVYGDPSVQESFSVLVARLEESLSAPEPDSLDARRVRLILAGQLEQAVEDGLPERDAACRALTDAAAAAFVDGGSKGIAGALRPLAAWEDAPLTVKLPEGFAFYGLYPEQYAVAAQRWLRDRPGGRCAVVGVRSIGTTLSAVVAAALRTGGTEAFRLTVRPTGHPFAREAALPSFDADWALVVDEGPGLSGSSMASVAEALALNGFPRDRIAFFPGHGGEPGAQASENVRDWWRETPRYVVGTEELRWDGLTLEETLMERTGDAARIEEMGGGRWREAVYRDPSEWPAVATAFERRKLRVTRRDGSAVLWKFVGFTVPGTALGFAAAPWIEGAALRQEDLTPEFVAQMGRHIAAVAGPPLSAHEATAARERLEEMLRVNAEEAGLSPHPPLQGRPLGEEERTAGDYRLAPWEWRRRANGDFVKAGQIAPTLDHTVVGRQPLAWDVAGAMVEWGLDDPTGLPPVADLCFYRAAYAASRMGQCATFAGSDEEGERLRRAAAFYRTALERALFLTEAWAARPCG